MATPQLMPNIMTGQTGQVAQGLQSIGVPPVGNAGGSNNPGPTGINQISNPIGAMPVPGGLVPTGTGTTSTVPGVLPGQGINQLNLSSPQGAIPVSQQSASSNQLNNVFGKGIGGDINSLINNLGSSDSSYMQAYTAAMAPQNAEGLATLNTTLGNSGVGANSSTAAIANADYQAQITGQEGLQEQQLQLQDQQTLTQLLESTEGAANKQASTSVLGDIGSVLGAVVPGIGPGLQALGDAGDL